MPVGRMVSDDKGVLTIIPVASIVIDGTVMTSEMREQDSARLLNDAFIWRDYPDYLSLAEVECRPRVLPLSLIIVRALSQGGIHERLRRRLECSIAAAPKSGRSLAMGRGIGNLHTVTSCKPDDRLGVTGEH